MSGGWDSGVKWHLELVTEPVSEPLDATTVLTDHLRAPDPTLELDYVDGLIKTARRMAERETRRAIPPQVWQLVMTRFPACFIQLPKPPLVAVESITYVDSDGVTQTWAEELYQISQPIGPQGSYATISPAYGESFPESRTQTVNAVRVQFRCGYETGSPALPNPPDDILHGMLLVIGELYKVRSESVHALSQSPAIIRAKDLWLGYRVY